MTEIVRLTARQRRSINRARDESDALERKQKALQEQQRTLDFTNLRRHFLAPVKKRSNIHVWLLALDKQPVEEWILDKDVKISERVKPIYRYLTVQVKGMAGIEYINPSALFYFRDKHKRLKEKLRTKLQVWLENHAN